MGKNETISTLEKLIRSSTTSCIQKNALRKAVQAVQKQQRKKPVAIWILAVDASQFIA